MNTNDLSISHCSVWAGDKQILRDVSLQFSKGSVTVIMGPNGSGKSTLAHVVMGDPIYRSKIKDQRSKNGFSLVFQGKDITNMPTEERARKGIFLSFQSPVAIPGVSVNELLRSSLDLKRGKKHSQMSEFLHMIRSYASFLEIKEDLLTRSIHEGFSGGERKKIELLQALLLAPKIAIFDEIDTGLDVDALRMVAKGIQKLQKQGTGIILITHTERILNYLDVDKVFIMKNGEIVKEGDKALIKEINKSGYKDF